MQTITTDLDICVGCNRCTRVCPVEIANQTYQDENGDIKIFINEDACIVCGACLNACHHQARRYVDDTKDFFEALAQGEDIQVMFAPSVRTNFPEWKRLITLLKNLGVKKVYDVSLGADICTWAHLRYLDQNPGAHLITQPCPAIVNYIEFYRSELLPYLSPVSSPIGCTTVLMKKYDGLEGKIAAVSPCIAKRSEKEAAGLDFSLVFAHLKEYLEENDIALPLEESDFDSAPAGLGSVFPMPGGLKDNIHLYYGDAVHVWNSEGHDVFHTLNSYCSTPASLRPGVLDVLNCAQGCNQGPGRTDSCGLYEINSIMYNQKTKATSASPEEINGILESFDNEYEIQDFLRGYKDHPVDAPVLTEEDIQNAMHELGKYTPEEQKVDCGACGSDRCYEMARKIAYKVNIPSNCIVKSRADAKENSALFESLYSQSNEYITLVNTIGSSLINQDSSQDSTSDFIGESLEGLCSLLGCTYSAVWRIVMTTDDVLVTRQHWWPENYKGDFELVSGSSHPGWFTKLSQNEPVLLHRSTASEEELKLFSTADTQTLLIVPVLAKNTLSAVITFNSPVERVFNDEDIRVVSSCGLLLAYNDIEEAITLHLLESNDDLKQIRELLMSVNQVAEKILSVEGSKFQEIIRDSLHLLGESVGASGVAVWENYSNEDEAIFARLVKGWVADNPEDEEVKRVDIDLERFFPEVMWKAKKSDGVLETGTVLDGKALTKEYEALAYCDALFLLPIVLKDTIWGLITFSYVGEHGSPKNEECEILHSGGMMIASSIVQNQTAENLKEAEKKASTDPLTGLTNRNGFNLKGPIEFDYCKDNGLPLTILFFDLDHFKHVNDTYGHPFGDIVLKAFANIIIRNSRAQDIKCRFGGEEIIVLLSNCDATTGLALADRILKAVSERSFREEPDCHLTVSAGMKTGVPGDDNTLEAFIQEADNSLYVAKTSGRNQVVVSKE